VCTLIAYRGFESHSLRQSIGRKASALALMPADGQSSAIVSIQRSVLVARLDGVVRLLPATALVACMLLGFLGCREAFRKRSFPWDEAPSSTLRSYAP